MIKVLRTFQISIILFWSVTSGLLVKSLFTKGEAGFTEVDSRRVIQSIFDWNDSTRLTLYQDQNQLSHVSMISFLDSRDDLPGFSLTSTLKGESIDSSIRGAFTSGQFHFNPDYTLANTSLIFRLRSQDLDVQLQLNDQNQMIAKATLAGTQIFNFEGDRDQAPDATALGILPPTLGSGLFSSLQSDTKLDITAYRGKHRILGRRLPVYLLKLATSSAREEIKIYLTEAGEPLIVETNFGLYAISEVIEPIVE